MKKSLKLRQIINKRNSYLFLILFFVLAVFLSSYKGTMANYLMVMNGGGGGGGGGTTTTTTTTGTVYTGAITLNVSPDKTVPYTGSKPIVVSSSASVSACSNTALNLKVTANVTGPETVSWGTLLNQGAVGGQTIASSDTFNAPKTSGTYTVNLTATRYDPAGYSLENSYGSPITSASNTQVVITGTTYYVSTNYRGRITSVGSSYGANDIPDYVIRYASPFSDPYGQTLQSSLISEDAIKTYTSSFTFEVGKPEVTVKKQSTQAIPYGTKDRVTWTQVYSNHCTCYTDPSYNTRCKDENGNTVPSGLTGDFYTEALNSSKTYYVKCDNLP